MASLGELYYRYQEEARVILEEGEYEIRNLQSVYYNHTIYYDSTGPDDPGSSEQDYFFNKYNPIIPVQFRQSYYPTKATKHSLAWLVFDIECSTFDGGKTKKRRFKKDNKSIKKSKNTKSKNTKSNNTKNRKNTKGKKKTYKK